MSGDFLAEGFTILFSDFILGLNDGLVAFSRLNPHSACLSEYLRCVLSIHFEHRLNVGSISDAHNNPHQQADEPS